MFLTVDGGPFFAGVRAPQNKDEAGFLVIEGADDSVGEFFPALVLVGAGLVGFNGESGIKK